VQFDVAVDDPTQMQVVEAGNHLQGQLVVTQELGGAQRGLLPV
jgi:hypothetical protein